MSNVVCLPLGVATALLDLDSNVKGQVSSLGVVIDLSVVTLRLDVLDISLGQALSHLLLGSRTVRVSLEERDHGLICALTCRVSGVTECR